MADSEKATRSDNANVTTTALVNEEKEAEEGYALDAALYDTNNLKLADDGRTVLIPQPSDDPEDPLNWPRSKKLAIVLTISTIAFLPEFGSAVGIPAIVPQSMLVDLSPTGSISAFVLETSVRKHRQPSKDC